MTALILSFADNLSQFTVSMGIGVFIYVILTKAVRRQPITLDELFVRTLAGAAIPSGLLIVICAFDTSLIAKLSDINVYLAFVGMGLIYISIKEAFIEKKKR